jgi:hypothetical protein
MRVLTLIPCLLACNAHAMDFDRSAKSGQTTRMGVYSNWGSDCKDRLGIVKVISKPSHGKLVPSQVASRVVWTRVTADGSTPCKGMPVQGFRVDYTSTPGFRGVDTFVLQFTYGNHVDIDHFTVSVH